MFSEMRELWQLDNIRANVCRIQSTELKVKLAGTPTHMSTKAFGNEKKQKQKN